MNNRKIIEAKVQFLSNRTCCVCNEKGKPIQIHHIDGNKKNNDIKNLAVLCIDCHIKTQLSGGFTRKLDEDQIILFRDEWHKRVSREREYAKILDTNEDDNFYLDITTTELEILKENKDYNSLAMLYNAIGNIELRDKYIELALKKDKSIGNEIFFRDMQDKIEKVDKKKINKELKNLKKKKDWLGLARLYNSLKEYKNVITCYCRVISETIEKGNYFTAAIYLKEFSELEFQNYLFEDCLKSFKKTNDIWWQIRCYQELEWYDELKDFLLKNKEKIEKSKDYIAMDVLYRITKEKEKLKQILDKIL